MHPPPEAAPPKAAPPKAAPPEAAPPEAAPPKAAPPEAAPPEAAPPKAAPPEAAPSPGRGRLRGWSAVLLVALGLGLVAVLARDLDLLGWIADERGAILAWCARHPVGAAALYIAALTALVALSVPGAYILVVAGGFLFGLLPGTLLAGLSLTAGGLLVFLAVRLGLGGPLRGGRGRLAAGPGGIAARVEAGLRENAVLCLLFLRLFPAVPFPVANLAPAVFGVPFRLFLWTTVAGVLPGAALLASVGVGLGDVIERGERPGIGLLADPAVVAPLAALGALTLLPLLLRRLRTA